MSFAVQTMPANTEHDRCNQLKVLRAVASLELAKGLVVLAAACAVIYLVQREDVGDIAFAFLRMLHISPDHHFARVFLEWADRMTDARISVIAGFAGIYCTLRFIEAYGLWKARTWAEWIALISGTLYLPIELFEVYRRVNLFHVTVLIVNLAIVLYMLYLIRQDRHGLTRAAALQQKASLAPYVK